LRLELQRKLIGGSNLAKNERNLKFKNNFKTNSQVRN